MSEKIELIKSLIRPFIIVWGFIVYGVCIMTAAHIPDLLAVLVAAVIIEYFGERAIFRFRENSNNREAKGGQ